MGGSRHLVYRGPGSHIYELCWGSEAMWVCSDLTIASHSVGVPAAGNPDGYTLGDSRHVVYRGADEHIHELYWQSGTWAHNDLTAASRSPVPAAGDPAGYTLGDSQHVVYRGADGHIHELYWQGGTWFHNDLTAATKSPVSAVDDPAGYVLGDSQHVVYRGGDGRIHELYWQGGTWFHNDLTAAAKSPVSAAGDPAGYTLGNSQHVVYRGTDKHIHELYWQEKSWSHHDLTASSHSEHAQAVGDPAGYILGNSQHVVYRGADAHIHELYWRGGSRWIHHDLTAASNSSGTAAASDPAAYILGNSQHVVYCGSNGQIYELHWEKGEQWRQNDLTLSARTDAPAPINGEVFEEYDIIVSITETTINRQLSRLVEMGVINQNLVLSQSIDEKSNYVYRKLNAGAEIPKDAQGNPASACLSCSVLPQIKISQSGTSVTLVLNFQSGFAYFWVLDSPPRLQKYDVTGWKYGISITLDLKAIEKDDIGKKIKIPSLVEQQLTQFQESDFEISHLFLDFDSVDLLRFDPTSTGTKDAGTPGNRQLAQFMQFYLIDLIKGGNPFVLGYSITASPNPRMPASNNVPDSLKPTGTTFTAYHDLQYPELSTLNFVLVTRGGHRRISGSPGNLNGNWIKPDDPCDGKIIYSHACFVEALLLQPLFQKIRAGVWSRIRRNVSAPQGKNYLAAKQVSPERWLFNISDITRGNNQYTNSFSVVVENQPNSVQFHFKGHVHVYKEVSKDCFFCTARAHASGTVDWSGQISVGTANNPARNAVMKLDHAFQIDNYSTPHGTNSCADAFDWIGTILGGIVDTFTAFRDDGFFSNLFSSALGVDIPGIGSLNVALENVSANVRSAIVLPSGGIFEFKNPSSDCAGNLSLQLTYKDPDQRALAGKP